MLLRIPSRDDPSRLGDLVRQDKMFDIFKEHHRWQHILGMSTVGDFNEAVMQGRSTDLINVSEALQEKKISQIADMISTRRGVRMVLISGPSSSGKTTFCKRLSIQLLTCGVKPVPVSLDDYFVDRELTPKDGRGEYDYESLYALNLPLLNSQLSALFRGDEVEPAALQLPDRAQREERPPPAPGRRRGAGGRGHTRPQPRALRPRFRKNRSSASTRRRSPPSCLTPTTTSPQPTTACCAASYETTSTAE